MLHDSTTYFSIVQIAYHPTFQLGGDRPVSIQEQARALNRAYAVPCEYGRGTRDSLRYLEYLKRRFIKGEIKSMALTMVGMNEFASVRGKVATEPKIAVSDKGQVRFNKLACAKFEGFTHLQVAVDNEKRAIVFIPTNEEKNKSGDNAKIGRPQEHPEASCYVNLGGVIKKFFPQYDMAKAGNQVYPITPYVVKTSKGGTQEFVSLVMPTATPAARPKVTRTKKDKETGKANGATAATPTPKATPATEEEEGLVL